MNKGLFIVLEGLDGAGKTTHKHNIMKRFQEAFPDKEVVDVREPGGTIVGEQIRSVVLSNPMNCYTRALLYAASRWELSEMIHDKLKKGAIVVCDRYIYSSLAYQTTNDAEIQMILDINRFNDGLAIPNYVFHFDMTMETYRDRKRARATQRELDELEKEPDSFFEKNIKQYENAYNYLEDCYYTHESGKIVMIDANKTLQEVTEQVEQELNKIIKEEQ